jgi:hypothetical protein
MTMAAINHDRVGKALESLKSGLGPLSSASSRSELGAAIRLPGAR